MALHKVNHETDQHVWSYCRSQGHSHQECSARIQESHTTFMKRCTEESLHSQQFCHEVLVRRIINNFQPPADELRKKPPITDRKIQSASQPCLSRGQTGSQNVAHCPHNDRGEISSTDIVEHGLNGEWGSAARDIAELPETQAAIEAAGRAVEATLEAIGDSVMSEPWKD